MTSRASRLMSMSACGRLLIAMLVLAGTVVAAPLTADAAKRKTRSFSVSVTPKVAVPGSTFVISAKGSKLPRACRVAVRLGGQRGKVVQRATVRRGRSSRIRLAGPVGARTVELVCGARKAFTAVTLRARKPTTQLPTPIGALPGPTTPAPAIQTPEPTPTPTPPADTDGELDASVIPSSAEDAAPDSGGPDPDLRLPFQCGEQWQASTYAGHVNSAIDWNQPGDGDAGRPVVASASGSVYVAPAGQYNGGYGNYVIVNHGGGWSTLYAHFRGYAVSNGQNVGRGQVLGFVGTTGNSTGNHLHYEQRRNKAGQQVRFSGGPVSAGRTYTSDNCGTSTPDVPGGSIGTSLTGPTATGNPGNYVGDATRQDFAYATPRADGGTSIAVWETTAAGIQWRGLWLDAPNVPFSTSTFVPADQDGDGRLDLYYATRRPDGSGMDVALLRNTGSTFSYVGQQWNPNGLYPESTRFMPGNFAGNASYQDFAYATRRSDGGTVIGMFESTPAGIQYRGSWLDASNVPFDTTKFIPADQDADGDLDLFYATRRPDGSGMDVAFLTNTGSLFSYVGQQWNPNGLYPESTQFLPTNG